MVKLKVNNNYSARYNRERLFYRKGDIIEVSELQAEWLQADSPESFTLVPEIKEKPERKQKPERKAKPAPNNKMVEEPEHNKK